MKETDAPDRPNLVYVFADQLRYASLGYTGDERAHTPHIDDFARQACDFHNAVATAPVCTAYRSALMTGRYTTSTGMVINELRMHPNQRCLGHVLTEAGYETAYIGKWHLFANQLGNHLDPRNSFVPPGLHRLGFDGYWAAYNFHHHNYDSYYHTDSPHKIWYGDGVYEPEAQTSLAIDWLRGRDDGRRPLALFLSWGPPHDPWGPDNVPARWWQMYADESFPHPPNYRAENDPYADGWGRFKLGEREQLESWRRGYYAQVASIDECFGRLLRAIDEQGLSGETIVVFTSDHGEMFGAHGRRAKNIFYDEACRTPFLLRWPRRVAPGSRCDACLGTVDIMPTLLGLMGLPVPHGVEGMDLSHLVLGKPGPEPEAALMQVCGATAAWQDGHEWRALRDKQYTYAIYRVDGAELLFDRVHDPWQMRNLATARAHRETLSTFRDMLRERMARLNDTFESCTWYRDHWTDGNRCIIRSATADFGPPVEP